jgi:uncharacterized membrane protein
MKTKHVLAASLVLMAGLLAFALIFRAEFMTLLNQPALFGHARFVHIAATTLFFANAVVGMIWERRSLRTGRKEVILHTYDTVAWLDARLSSPLIVLSVITGLALGFMMGNLWEVGWLSVGFVLFLLSGLIWVASDIPTQYRLKSLMAALDPTDECLPEELLRLLRLRSWIGLAGVAPLVAVFALMVYKPEIPALASLFG